VIYLTWVNGELRDVAVVDDGIDGTSTREYDTTGNVGIVTFSEEWTEPG
jgi:hypothetical protein